MPTIQLAQDNLLINYVNEFSMNLLFILLFSATENDKFVMITIKQLRKNKFTYLYHCSPVILLLPDLTNFLILLEMETFLPITSLYTH